MALIFKVTVSVILSYPTCKDGNARFTMVPLNPLSDKKCECGMWFFYSKSVYFFEFVSHDNPEMRKSL